MAIKFQYNKTSLQDLNRQLRIRVRALPTLKNKESALRVEVKKARDAAQSREEALEMRSAQLKSMLRLWEEFDPNLVQVDAVDIKSRKIAGVRVPELEKVSFQIQAFSLFLKPHWFADGAAILEELATIAIEREFYMRTMQLLDPTYLHLEYCFAFVLPSGMLVLHTP